MLRRTNVKAAFTLAEGATHVEMFGKARKSAFTLAEVLITLGIIGVVAAMTMPTLINSTQGAQYKTAYKKALSVMSQAVVMNIALEDYDLSQTVKGTNAVKGGTSAGGTQSMYDLFKNRMNVVKVAGTGDFVATDGQANTWKLVGFDNNENLDDADNFVAGTSSTTKGDDDDVITTTGGHGATKKFSEYIGTDTWAANNTVLFFNDGITFIFDNTQQNCAAATATTSDSYCTGFIDVNGQKAPNRLVSCDNGTLDGEGTDNGNCTVTNPTDIYPVALYDQSIVPASAAARAVLYAK